MTSPNQSASLRNFIKSIPLIGLGASKVARLPIVARARGLAFHDSASYWESRYRNGDSSGAGSYGRLAEFKAAILNDFVKRNEIRTVIEFGCGDGAQLELAAYPEYVGVDVAAASIEACSTRFAPDHTKRFYLAHALPSDIGRFDLTISLDVIYHLVEDSVFDSYMRSLFARAQRHVVIYASNYNGTAREPHVRHREFTNWITENAREWQPAGYVPNRFPFDPDSPRDTSFADFHFFVRRVPRSLEFTVSTAIDK
jgi:cyclopropane fatty-acyl-phospholipid synthase-like methyltransferase